MQSRTFLEAHVLVVAIAQEGSFLRAAKRLGMPQPSLTRKIAQIEDDIGAKLFDRTSRRVRLTRAGDLFVAEATITLDHAERAWGLAGYQARIDSGPIRIGYSPYTHSAFLPLLQRLHPPGAEPSAVTLESATTPEMMHSVLRGKLHAALGVIPVADDDLWVQPVGQEGFSVCVPKNHALSQKTFLTVHELDGESLFWIPRSVHPGLYHRVLNYIQSAGVQPIFREVKAANHALEFVAHGFGLALLPRSASHMSRTGVVFKHLTDRYLRIETAIFMRKDQRHGSLRGFIDDLIALLQSLKTDIH